MITDLCRRHGLDGAFEQELTLGVWQRSEWDICRLPGMSKPGNPVEVGDVLRARTERELPS